MNGLVHVLCTWFKAHAIKPGARYYLSHREKIFDPRFWRLPQPLPRKKCEAPRGIPL
jgi:hypothetical protein